MCHDYKAESPAMGYFKQYNQQVKLDYCCRGTNKTSSNYRQGQKGAFFPNGDGPRIRRYCLREEMRLWRISKLRIAILLELDIYHRCICKTWMGKKCRDLRNVGRWRCSAEGLYRNAMGLDFGSCKPVHRKLEWIDPETYIKRSLIAKQFWKEHLNVIQKKGDWTCWNCIARYKKCDWDYMMRITRS